MNLIRIGYISTVNYDKGTASVVFRDNSNTVSPQFPFLSFTYDPPAIDDMVIVLMLPNSKSKGFIIGTPYNSKRRPVGSGANIVRKDFKDGAYVEYNTTTKTMKVSAEHIIADEITVTKIIADEVIINETFTNNSIGEG